VTLATPSFTIALGCWLSSPSEDCASFERSLRPFEVFIGIYGLVAVEVASICQLTGLRTDAYLRPVIHSMLRGFADAGSAGVEPLQNGESCFGAYCAPASRMDRTVVAPT
jgi:hypothetical protein